MWSSQHLANQLNNISTNGKLIWQNDYGKSMWQQLDRKTITITTIDIWRTMFLKLTRFWTSHNIVQGNTYTYLCLWRWWVCWEFVYVHELVEKHICLNEMKEWFTWGSVM